MTWTTPLKWHADVELTWQNGSCFVDVANWLCFVVVASDTAPMTGYSLTGPMTCYLCDSFWLVDLVRVRLITRALQAQSKSICLSQLSLCLLKFLQFGSGLTRPNLADVTWRQPNFCQWFRLELDPSIGPFTCRRHGVLIVHAPRARKCQPRKIVALGGAWGQYEVLFE